MRDIDCPELAQSFGRQAKKLVADLCLGETVTVQADGKDKYDRTLAHIILADGNELNRELVRREYAWWYRKYSKDETLGQLESDARKNKIGLWADAKPVAPWDWRAARRAKSDVVPSEMPRRANLDDHCGHWSRDGWAVGASSTLFCLYGGSMNNYHHEFPGSEHPGGVQFGMTGGSVRFLSEDMDSATLRWMGTIDGQEVLPSGY